MKKKKMRNAAISKIAARVGGFVISGNEKRGLSCSQAGINNAQCSDIEAIRRYWRSESDH